MYSACFKARRYTLAPKKIIVFLKKQNFETDGSEASISRPCACPLEFSSILRDLFHACYRPEELYRATGVILLDLIAESNVQYTLFDDPVRAEKIRDVYAVTDELAQKFGKHTVHLGSTHLMEELGKGRRGVPTVREQTQLKGETSRRHLALPLLHVKT